jgi:LDH2 family malate/lactate/ureidoglycolate dehydrogenase
LHFLHSRFNLNQAGYADDRPGAIPFEASVSATVIRRYRLDDLRRFAAALGCASGLAPPRALALASHLLWFNAAGAASFGIVTLPCWLERIENGSIDLTATGTVTTERPSLAMLDGHDGIAPLVLERAAELAIEKARDTAVGLVRITHLGRLASAAAVVAAMALRPVAGLVLGPGGVWSAAVPSSAGLPILFDSALAAIEPSRTGAGTAARAARHGASPKPAPVRLLPPPLDGVANWREVLVPEETWLVAAVAVAELEPLSDFHGRVARWIQGLAESPTRLLPASWADRHAEAHERGVTIAAPAWKELKQWANRFAVAVPSPRGS